MDKMNISFVNIDSFLPKTTPSSNLNPFLLETEFFSEEISEELSTSDSLKLDAPLELPVETPLPLEKRSIPWKKIAKGIAIASAVILGMALCYRAGKMMIGGAGRIQDLSKERQNDLNEYLSSICKTAQKNFVNLMAHFA